MGGGFKQLAAQLLGLSVIVVWTFGLSVLLFLLLKWAPRLFPMFFPAGMFNGLRVTFEDEERGLDYSKHGGSAYVSHRIVCLVMRLSRKW